ncbi:MAG: hypothetical protein H0X46_05640 [Bacteroidetes bacterium]|nr:hypothetical protein [Bacteroidota bacterium]
MTTISNIRWSLSKKFIFLFTPLYTFFYIFPFPFDAFPQVDFIFNYYERLNDSFTLWAGRHIFGITHIQKLPFSDSGDTTFGYTKVLIFFILSLILALTIVIFDKKRNNYEKSYAWLFVYIRYCIGFYMLVYGFDKVFKSHFPFPSLEKLEQPFGQSSPQGLLWAFMGYSTTYTIYLGIIEVLSGFLLFFRRTAALGAVIVLAIMINVTVVNFSYDVPVKLFALHLVAYAMILLSPYFNSIFSFFVLKKEVKLAEQAQPVYPQIIHNYRRPIKFITIGAFTILFMNFSIVNMRTDGDSAPKPPLYGIYKTTARPSDNISEIIFDEKTTMIKRKGHNLYFETAVDTLQHLIHFRSNADTSAVTDLRYQLDGDVLTLIEQDSMKIVFKKIDLKSYPLISRGFHWVVEYPENN